VPIIAVLHVGLALVALGAGFVVCLTRKGTRTHVRWGWTYAVAMIGLNGTALMLYRLLGHFGPFHVAALFSLVTVVAGLVPAVRKADRFWLLRHGYWMAGSYVGLWAAAVAEVTTRMDLLPFWWMTALASSVVGATGAAMVLRFVPGAIRGMKPARAIDSRSPRFGD